MALERMACCGALTREFSDAGRRKHAPNCKEQPVADTHAFDIALKEAEKSGIRQGEPFSVPVTIRVVMWPTNEVLNEEGVVETQWRPTPREIAQEINDRLVGLDLDTGWAIGQVTGGV